MSKKKSAKKKPKKKDKRFADGLRLYSVTLPERKIVMALTKADATALAGGNISFEHEKFISEGYARSISSNDGWDYYGNSTDDDDEKKLEVCLLKSARDVPEDELYDYPIGDVLSLTADEYFDDDAFDTAVDAVEEARQADLGKVDSFRR